jgi:hypothetical protein
MLILKDALLLNSINDPDILKFVKMHHDQPGDKMFETVIMIEDDNSM